MSPNVFIPSKYQKGFFNWLVSGTGSAIVVAVAGSGKTTTIKRALPYIPEHLSVQLFAFNTDAAANLKTAIAEMAAETGRSFANMRAGTFHSACYMAVCRALKKAPREVQTDAGKMRKIARDVLGEAEYEMYGDFVCKLVGYAKGEGIGPLTPDTADAWWKQVSHHDLTLDHEDADEERAIEIARGLLRRSNEESKKGRIDFDDQLYLPLLWKLKLFQNDIVFLDEGQDTNPVRRAIAKLALKPGGRLATFGDPKQGIYGFTGATSDALDVIKQEFNAIELPLTVCYRCDAAIVNHAKRLVPYIEAAPGAGEGVVASAPRDPQTGAATWQTMLAADDAILCRNTAPLIAMAYELLGQGIACRVAGRDIGVGLVNLIKKMKAKGLENLTEKLLAWQEREIAKFTAKGEEQKAEAIRDKVECIETFVAMLDERARTVPALIAKIESLFGEGNVNVLTLSTIHKAKGREWNKVVIIRPDLMPSKWARQDHQFQQELNLIYVAETRARHTLWYDGPVPFEGGL